jgi:gas vesicle structural protein
MASKRLPARLGLPEPSRPASASTEASAFPEVPEDGRSLVRLRAKRYGETSTKLEERSRGGGRSAELRRRRSAGLQGPPQGGPQKRNRETPLLEQVFDEPDASLLDLLDRVLSKGMMANGNLTLGVAGVDLIYVRLAAILCAADRVLAPDPRETPRKRRRARASNARR